MKTIENDFKGTPGDWTLEDEPNGQDDAVIICDGCPIATVRGTNDMGCIDEDDEAGIAEELAANARLFANSKKVLELLIEELENRKNTWDADDQNSTTYKKIQQLEQAINDSL